MKILKTTNTGIISSVQRYKIKWKKLKWVIEIPKRITCTHLIKNRIATINKIAYNKNI